MTKTALVSLAFLVLAPAVIAKPADLFSAYDRGGATHRRAE